jgi:hypothetical protein
LSLFYHRDTEVTETGTEKAGKAKTREEKKEEVKAKKD